MKMQTAFLEVVIPPDIIYEEVKLNFLSFCSQALLPFFFLSDNAEKNLIKIHRRRET